MSDFVDGFWGYYIASITLLGIVWCIWLLFSQRRWLKTRVEQVEDTGHVWDGNLRELNNPVPRWWTWMYVLFCAFGLLYLFLYPGLGTFGGYLGHSSAKEVQEDQAYFNAAVKPVYAAFEKMSIPEIAANPEARTIGQRLFLNNCAQCHGSDARGGVSFPNLMEGDSIYGRTPESIALTITKGRNGVMPGFKETIDAKKASEIAQYVRSLSGLAHDQIKVVAGKREYMNNCAACHGPEGKGSKEIGAPNLTDGVWLYSSSENSIVQTILNGRNNRMPAQEHVLSPDQIRMLTAYVWGMTQGKEQVASK